MPTVFGYVDGFNLYHRALKDNPSLKWLDIPALMRLYLNADDKLERVRYYTSRVSGRTDQGQPLRQDAYIRALVGLGVVTVHFGNFLSRPVCRPLLKTIPLVHPRVNGHQYVMVHNTEEKGSDVNLASHLLRDGFQGLYDAAIVISSDGDLIEPLRIVKEEIKKPVILAYPDLERGSVPIKLKAACSVVRYMRRADLFNCQLVNPARARNGQLLVRPKEWT
jgi:uncharacterized LabA/DUF88 family protein